jgi:Flp pilus assembly protein TadD
MPRFHASLGVLAVSAFLATTAQAATQEPQSSAATLLQSVDTGIRDAQTRRSQGDYAGAVRVLSQLMLMAADDPRVVSEYGKALVQEGRAREALDFLNRAAQLAQGDWSVYSALGVAYDQTGDFASARTAYERALALNPGSTTVLNNYAMSRALAGDLPMARKLIADASAGSTDERITRNLKMINSLTPQITAAAPPVAKTTPVAPRAVIAAPRTLTPAEGIPRPDRSARRRAGRLPPPSPRRRRNRPRTAFPTCASPTIGSRALRGAPRHGISQKSEIRSQKSEEAACDGGFWFLTSDF